MLKEVHRVTLTCLALHVIMADFRQPSQNKLANLLYFLDRSSSFLKTKRLAQHNLRKFAIYIYTVNIQLTCTTFDTCQC